MVRSFWTTFLCRPIGYTDSYITNEPDYEALCNHPLRHRIELTDASIWIVDKRLVYAIATWHEKGYQGDELWTAVNPLTGKREVVVDQRASSFRARQL